MRAQLAIAELLEPLRSDPAVPAILLDIDGTLAPIVRHASDAHVPESTRLRLIGLAKRYGLVACVSGRSAAVARQMVSIGSIAYVGNPRSGLLAPAACGAVGGPRRPARRSSIRRSPNGPIACARSPIGRTHPRSSSCASGARTRARSSA